MPLRSYPVKLTDEQVEAVEAAFPDSPNMPFSEKLRSLVASGLSLFQIEWPQIPQHGGKREGAGRKKEHDAEAGE
jgi:hypothetical protein